MDTTLDAEFREQGLRVALKLLGTDELHGAVLDLLHTPVDFRAPLRDSGIPWLGLIPAHWPLFRAKYLWKEQSLPIREGDEMVTCFGDGQVTLRKNRREEGFTLGMKELGYQGIRVGQLVLHSMDAFAGAIGVSDSDGKCTPEYIICDAIRDDLHHPITATCSA